MSRIPNKSMSVFKVGATNEVRFIHAIIAYIQKQNSTKMSD